MLKPFLGAEDDHRRDWEDLQAELYTEKEVPEESRIEKYHAAVAPHALAERNICPEYRSPSRNFKKRSIQRT